MVTVPEQFVPKFYKEGIRVKEVASVFFKHGFFWVAEVLEMTRFFPKSLRERVTSADEYQLPVSVRMRRVIEELGPTYIKAGQILSSRPDMIPPDILRELSKLQDEVPPFAFEHAQDIMEEELGLPMDQVFRSFARVPIASASIGQVHEAVLIDGREVVVKVQRPDIEQRIEIDLSIMTRIARAAENRFEWARLYNFVERVEEFAKTIRAEMDYTVEGHNADRLAANFEDDETIYIPAIYWEYTTRRVLTMEYIHGVKIKEKEKLAAKGCDFTYLTEVIGNAYIKMILIDGFFHGDPHFGNIFVMEGQVVALIDFGMVGIIDPIMKRNMAKYFIAIVSQDAEGIVEVLEEIAEIDPDTDRPAMIREIGRLLQKYADITIGQIKLEQIVTELFTLGMKYRVTLPGEFTLMDKTLITLEGLGRHLDPTFDLIAAAEPAARMLLRREMDPRNFSKDLIRTAIDMRDLLMAMPKRLDRISRGLESGQLKVRIEMENYMDAIQNTVERMGQSVNRLSLAIVIAALLVATSTVMSRYEGVTVFNRPLPDIFLIALLLFAVVWIIAVWRSGRFGKK